MFKGANAMGRGLKCTEAGVTRRDVVFLVFSVCVLAALGWRALGGGEFQRTLACKYKLGRLGAAFAQYADENARAIPPAALETGRGYTTWDTVLGRYLANTRAGDGAATGSELIQRTAAAFHCPSDTEPRGGEKPRSYSMPMYDVKREGWPPVVSSQGGLGLYLDAERLKLACEAAPVGLQSSIPSIRISMVPDPAWTALLVERVAIRNVLGTHEFVVTAGPREQWAAKTIELDKFHRGRLNYLMLDGHVERLSIRESGGHAGNGGVWTIRPWD